MAEHQAPARGRRRDPEQEPYAIAFRGALPERQQRGNPNQWADWRGGNGNHGGHARKQTRFELDTAVILRLLESGRVHDRELCSYRSSAVILGQDPQFHPINALILDIINEMAFNRRVVLDCMVKRKPNAPELKEHQDRLALLPVQVQELQGQVEALGGQYLQIPALFDSPVEFLN